MALVAMLIGKKSPPTPSKPPPNPSLFYIPSPSAFQAVFEKNLEKRLAKCWFAGIKAFCARRQGILEHKAL
jgi:hypothetical protein